MSTYSDDPTSPGWAVLRTDEVDALACAHYAMWWRGEPGILRAPHRGHEPVSWRALRFVRAERPHLATDGAHLAALTDAALERASDWTPCRLVTTGEYRVQPVVRSWVDWRDLPERVRCEVEETCFREGRDFPWEITD